MTAHAIGRSALIASIAFLPFRLGGALSAPNLKPSETLLALSLIVTIISAYKDYRAGRKISWDKVKKVLFPITILYAILLLGTASSFMKFPELPVMRIMIEYARFSAAVVFFLLTYWYAQGDTRFIRQACAAFLVSPIINIVSLFPSIVRAWRLTDGVRYWGFFDDPNYFANFSIVPTVLLVSYLVLEPRSMKQKIAAGAGGLLMLRLVFWSGSRSGWIGLGVALVVVTITAMRFAKKKIAAGAYILIILFFALGGSFFTLTKTQRTSIAQRAGIISVYSDSANISTANDTGVPPSLFSPIIKSLDRGIARFAHDQDRLNLWRASLSFIMQNPLGFGPAYYEIINIRSGGLEHRSSHSIIFEILLTAGVFGLLFFSVIAYLLFMAWKNQSEPDYILVGIMAALAGTLVSTLFLDSLSLRWLWILAAFVFARAHHPRPSMPQKFSDKVPHANQCHTDDSQHKIYPA